MGLLDRLRKQKDAPAETVIKEDLSAKIAEEQESFKLAGAKDRIVECPKCGKTYTIHYPAKKCNVCGKGFIRCSAVCSVTRNYSGGFDTYCRCNKCGEPSNFHIENEDDFVSLKWHVDGADSGKGILHWRYICECGEECMNGSEREGN